MSVRRATIARHDARMTPAAADPPLEGGCTCRAVRFRLASRPLFVHCCHCTWCQRESGASFALNAMIESERVELLSGAPELVDTPSASGAGQRIARCPRCRVAVWSHYAGAGDAIRFVRVGTLDEPGRLPPDIHIFTASKQPWVVLPPGTPAVSAVLRPQAVLAGREPGAARRDAREGHRQGAAGGLGGEAELDAAEARELGAVVARARQAAALPCTSRW